MRLVITVLFLAQTACAVKEEFPSESFLLGKLFTLLEEFGVLKTQIQTMRTIIEQLQGDLGGQSAVNTNDIDALRTELQRQRTDFELELGNMRQALDKSLEENQQLKTQLQGLRGDFRELRASQGEQQSVSHRLLPFWSEWTHYSSCSASCGAGTTSRTRTCDTPATRCSGAVLEQAECNMGACPEWSAWTELTQCSVSCGEGIKKRTRTCQTPDVACPGPAAEELSCIAYNCGEVLLIAGGTDNSAEVLGLNGEGVTCGVSVPDLPVQGNWGVFFHVETDPVFCEGFNGSSCFKYSPKLNKWEHFARLSTTRKYASTLTYLNGSVLVAGGKTGSVFKDTTDYWNQETGRFEPGPDLAYPAGYQCFTRVNSTHALLTGGYGDGILKNGYMWDGVAEDWTDVEAMKQRRHAHACGLVDQSRVFVAGGYDGGEMSSVEMFHLETQTWSPGPELPFPISSATSIQLEGTFLIVGGRTSSGSALNTVLQFDVESNNWVFWNQKLKKKRDEYPGVYILKSDYLDCTPSNIL